MLTNSPEDEAGGIYPPIDPYRSGHLRVSDVHELYFEECGNPDGLPVLVLHGGPGAGSIPESRRFFNPKRYRIIQFDQRGAGRSRPHACLEDNTTWALIDDIERLRNQLTVESWTVFGGSWGSTLALAYAEQHPSRVKALVLRGIFLARRWEIDWLYRTPRGTGALFPDAWEVFCGHIPIAERDDLIAAYYQRLTSEDSDVRAVAARNWSIWEGSVSHLNQNAETIAKFGDPDFAAAMARVECHYFMNEAFFQSENYLIENIDKIRSIPGIIIHGRYDVVCPVSNAWELHRAWPEAELHIIAAAGHSMFEKEISRALVSAMDRLGKGE